MDHESSYRVETLLDATILLYDECCTSSFKKEKTVSEFVARGTFLTPVSQAKPGATFSVPYWIMVWAYCCTCVWFSKLLSKAKATVTPNVSTLDRSSRLAVLSNHHWKLPSSGEGGVIFPFKLYALLYLSSTLCACIHDDEQTCNRPLQHISKCQNHFFLKWLWQYFLRDLHMRIY